MAQYRVSFIFRYGVQGWSEQWYAQGTSPDSLAAGFTTAQLGRYCAPKGTGCFLQAIRVSDVLNPRTSSLRIVEQYVGQLGAGGFGVGEMGGASVLGYLIGAGGSRRPLLLRGMAGDLVQYDTDGLPIFSSQFNKAWSSFLSGVMAMGLQIQTLTPASNLVPNVPIVSLAQSTADATVTQVNLNPTGPYSLPAMGRVRFHGLPKTRFPGYQGNIKFLSISTTSIVVPVLWAFPQPVLYLAAANLRVASYNYNLITGGAAEDFRTHKVGRPSLLARGRRAGTKYRGY